MDISLGPARCEGGFNFRSAGRQVRGGIFFAEILDRHAPQIDVGFSESLEQLFQGDPVPLEVLIALETHDDRDSHPPELLRVFGAHEAPQPEPVRYDLVIIEPHQDRRRNGQDLHMSKKCYVRITNLNACREADVPTMITSPFSRSLSPPRLSLPTVTPSTSVPHALPQSTR